MDSPAVKPTLRIRGLSVSYNSRNILADFQLDLAPRSCTAIVGYSGCGKSTLLKSIVGLVPARTGDAWLGDDQFLESGSITVHPWSLRRQLTLVTQQSGLLPYKTVRDNIALSAEIVLGATPQVAASQAEEMATKVGLKHVLLSYPNELSGGELQRAHLARALVLKPIVFLLDEITSNVDPRTAEAIGEALQYLHSTCGTSMLLVSHDFSAVKSLADRVIFLHEGKNFEEVSNQHFPEGFQTADALSFTATARRQVNHD
jgi:polar amino acid transport system ATP-binding protein